jgi:hypothetical protein
MKGAAGQGGPRKEVEMNYALPLYIMRPWWEIEAEGRAGRPQRRLEALAHQKLEAQIAGRRALCTARMKVIRTRSERNIAKLIRETIRP